MRRRLTHSALFLVGTTLLFVGCFGGGPYFTTVDHPLPEVELPALHLGPDIRLHALHVAIQASFSYGYYPADYSVLATVHTDVLLGPGAATLTLLDEAGEPYFEIAPTFTTGTDTLSWLLEITPNEDMLRRLDHTASVDLEVTVLTFLDEDVGAPVDVRVSLMTQEETTTEHLFLVAGEQATVFFYADLLADCVGQPTCTERIRVAVQTSGRSWVGAAAEGEIYVAVPWEASDSPAFDVEVITEEGGLTPD